MTFFITGLKFGEFLQLELKVYCNSNDFWSVLYLSHTQFPQSTKLASILNKVDTDIKVSRNLSRDTFIRVFKLMKIVRK